MANILRRAGVDFPEPVRRFLEGDLESWLRVEEYREGDQLVVKAEVPGINPENDVDITIDRDQLQIVVRREEKSEHKSKAGYRSEFRYGTFSRTVTLPAGVQQDGCPGLIQRRRAGSTHPRTGRVSAQHSKGSGHSRLGSTTP